MNKIGQEEETINDESTLLLFAKIVTDESKQYECFQELEYLRIKEVDREKDCDFESNYSKNMINANDKNIYSLYLNNMNKLSLISSKNNQEYFSCYNVYSNCLSLRSTINNKTTDDLTKIDLYNTNEKLQIINVSDTEQNALNKNIEIGLISNVLEDKQSINYLLIPSNPPEKSLCPDVSYLKTDFSTLALSQEIPLYHSPKTSQNQDKKQNFKVENLSNNIFVHQNSEMMIKKTDNNVENNTNDFFLKKKKKIHINYTEYNDCKKTKSSSTDKVVNLETETKKNYTDNNYKDKYNFETNQIDLKNPSETVSNSIDLKSLFSNGTSTSNHINSLKNLHFIILDENNQSMKSNNSIFSNDNDKPQETSDLNTFLDSSDNLKSIYDNNFINDKNEDLSTSVNENFNDEFKMNLNTIPSKINTDQNETHKYDSIDNFEVPYLDSYKVNPDSGLIGCICGVDDDDGFTIQCDVCFRWQHCFCMGFKSGKEIPDDEYKCYYCDKKKWGLFDSQESKKKTLNRLLVEKNVNELKNQNSTFKIKRKNYSLDKKKKSDTKINKKKKSLFINSNNSSNFELQKKHELSEESDNNDLPFLLYSKLLENKFKNNEIKVALQNFYITIYKNSARKKIIQKQNFSFQDFEIFYLFQYESLLNNDFFFKSQDNTSNISKISLKNRMLKKKIKIDVKKLSDQRQDDFNESSDFGLFISSTNKKSMTIPKNTIIIECIGEIDSFDNYKNNSINQFSIWGSTKPSVQKVTLKNNEDSVLELVIDSRFFGNESRFIRKSCPLTANCEIKKIFVPEINSFKFLIKTSKNIDLNVNSFEEELRLSWDWDKNHPISKLYKNDFNGYSESNVKELSSINNFIHFTHCGCTTSNSYSFCVFNKINKICKNPVETKNTTLKCLDSSYENINMELLKSVNNDSSESNSYSGSNTINYLDLNDTSSDLTFNSKESDLISFCKSVQDSFKILKVSEINNNLYDINFLKNLELPFSLISEIKIKIENFINHDLNNIFDEVGDLFKKKKINNPENNSRNFKNLETKIINEFILKINQFEKAIYSIESLNDLKNKDNEMYQKNTNFFKEFKLNEKEKNEISCEIVIDEKKKTPSNTIKLSFSDYKKNLK